MAGVELKAVKKTYVSVTAVEQSDVTFDFVFVDQESFDKYSPKSFGDLVTNFRQYKD